MYNNAGIANELSELLKLIAPLVGLFALTTVIVSIKNYGLTFIDEGKDTMTSFLSDGLNIVENPP